MGGEDAGQAADVARPRRRHQRSADHGRQADIAIDRATASRLSVTPQQIDDALYDGFGQRQVSTMYTPLNQYHVVMEIDPRFAQDPSALRDLFVRPPNGDPIPLSAFTRYEPTASALSVNHTLIPAVRSPST